MISRAEIDELSGREKADLLDDVWASLAAELVSAGPSEEELRLLIERNEEIEKDPAAATISFDEFKRRLKEGR